MKPGSAVLSADLQGKTEPRRRIASLKKEKQKESVMPYRQEPFVQHSSE
jgi:hypothetical protein